MVNDYQGKPVLVVDASRRIAGAAEYGPFGEVNTRYLGGESAHPYPNNLGQTLASWTQDAVGMGEFIRVNFDAFDIEPIYDSVQVRDGVGNTLLNLGGYHVGRFATQWVSNPGGAGSVRLNADSINCGPTDPSCSQGLWSYTGVAVRTVEYARAQSGATPWLPPLRFSGQYFDQETSLHENWNRFYEAESGRYLSPEPLLQSPTFIYSMAAAGMGAPTYAYAANNPLGYVDPDGLRILTSLTALPPKFGPTSCPDVVNGGSLPGCTKTSLASPIKVGTCYRAQADLRCSGGAKGPWKFDVSLDLNAQPEFHSAAAMSLPSDDSPGLTLEEHEGLHKGDVRAALSGINAAIQTEGFATRQACQAARANARKKIGSYYQMSASGTFMLRDVHP